MWSPDDVRAGCARVVERARLVRIDEERLGALARNLPDGDQPDPTDCYTRNESIIPQQALALSNSQFSYTQARRLARRIFEKIGAAGSDADFIEEAFETILDHPPTAAEKAASEKFLREGTELLGKTQALATFKAGSTPEVAPSADPPCVVPSASSPS